MLRDNKVLSEKGKKELERLLTVTGSGKPATMETGLVVNVPDFIEAGEYLEVNTSEGTYVRRATK